MLTSVVIPTRDAADQLLYTLFSLNLQYTPFEEFEVIVLDNASRDGVAQRVEQFRANYSLNCVRFRKRMPLHHLLNTGIRETQGELIIFLSCNRMVPRDFIGCHQHAHEHDDSIVLLGLNAKRIYSVYDPGFSPIQHAECRDWLEQYPQIKRPHSRAHIIPLLAENQIASGLPFHIGLTCPEALKRLAICQKYGNHLDNHRAPWTLFHTGHASLSRDAIARNGVFKELPRIEMERDLAKRLYKTGCRFQFETKLTLLKQERAVRKALERSVSKKNRRAQ